MSPRCRAIVITVVVTLVVAVFGAKVYGLTVDAVVNRDAVDALADQVRSLGGKPVATTKDVPGCAP